MEDSPPNLQESLLKGKRAPEAETDQNDDGKPSIYGCKVWVLKVLFASICMGIG